MNFLTNNLLTTFTFIVILVPSTIPVVEDKSLKTHYQVSFVLVEAK